MSTFESGSSGGEASVKTCHQCGDRVPADSPVHNDEPICPPCLSVLLRRTVGQVGFSVTSVSTRGSEVFVLGKPVPVGRAGPRAEVQTAYLIQWISVDLSVDAEDERVVDDLVRARVPRSTERRLLPRRRGGL